MPSERDYAERLREQAYKTLSPQINELEQELKEFSNFLSSGIYQIERKLEAISQVELPTTKVVLDEIVQEVVRQKDHEEKSLVLFTRDLRYKETQEEILGLLLDYAYRFFPRIALFTLRNDRFIGWSSRGYSEETARNIAAFSRHRSECPQFQEVLEKVDITTVPDLFDNRALSFLQEESAGASHLVPLHVMQRPVAILLVEGGDEAISRTSALSVLTNLTEFRLENIALKILYALTEVRTTKETEPAAEPEPLEQDAETEFAILEPEQLEQDAETEFAVEPEQPEQAAETELVIIEPEQPEQDAETKLAIVELEEPEQAAETEPAAEPEQPEVKISEAEEEKLHSDAKRFARLLISEIKLYNENTVLEGRGNHDLYLRLKQDIDKSREMYESRVSPIVLKKIDYFHDEVVRILGDNDAATLGSDYPGPRIES